VLEQHAPHRGRGDGEEVTLALPRLLALVDHAQPRLVHERGRLQRVRAALPLEMARGEPAQLSLHGGDELGQEGAVPRAQLSQETRHVLRHRAPV
jgi:hypothetical protein